MEFDEGGGMQVTAPRPAAAAAAAGSEAPASSVTPSLDEESMWQMNLRAGESMDSGLYPDRPGEPDCAYYLRTGLCRFGMTCKFNHPPNRNLALARMNGGYPERGGQPECQYYLRTGTCKFGPTCKFHHPKDRAGIIGRVQLNILGYPLRPNEKECAYYLRTGQCKFGNTCKFHHPQLSNAVFSLHASSVYPSVSTLASPGQQSFTGGLANWPLSKASIIASPRWQGPSNYTQLVFPQGLVQFPSWNAFPGQLGSASSPESQHHNTGKSQLFGSSHQSETTVGPSTSFSSIRLASGTMEQYALQRDNVFPERPGEPECQFYLKTGDCKFGAVCRFHHPRERIIPAPNCMLSPLGLPLRPGEPLCIFYSRYGICKFGPNCKFDHPMASPMGLFAYSLSTSSSHDVSVVRRHLGSSSRPPATLSSEGSPDAASGNVRCLSYSDSGEMASGNGNIESE